MSTLSGHPTERAGKVTDAAGVDPGSGSDRLLLEAAARAACLTEAKWSETCDCLVIHCAYSTQHRRAGDWSIWNPLENDDDALRLAVKLRIVVQLAPRYVVAIIDMPHAEIAKHEDLEADPYAATRRAIVRAAAALASTASGSCHAARSDEQDSGAPSGGESK